MKLLYKPFAIVAGIVGTKLGKRVFKRLWTAIDGRPEPPPPTTGEAPIGKVAAGAALEAATIAAIAAIVDRLSARTFRHLFGAWPERPASVELAAADDPPPAGEPASARSAALEPAAAGSARA